METVTIKEFNALKSFCSCNENISDAIKSYIKHSDTWCSDYSPLRRMGLEKFVKCLVNGYEIEFNQKLSKEFKESDGTKLIISYSTTGNKEYLLKLDKPIYFYINNAEGIELTISQAEDAISHLRELIDQYNTIRSDY